MCVATIFMSLPGTVKQVSGLIPRPPPAFHAIWGRTGTVKQVSGLIPRPPPAFHAIWERPGTVKQVSGLIPRPPPAFHAIWGRPGCETMPDLLTQVDKLLNLYGALWLYSIPTP